MKTNWDYSDLAEAYLKRPDYASDAINKMLSFFGCIKGDRVCDVGAGVAHLTLELAARGFEVSAVEPNDSMRALGIKRTAELGNVVYSEGTGEETGLSTDSFDFVTFGSSFNVTDREKSMKETVRILKPKGYFAVMWNHRDLTDPIQKSIEDTIRRFIPEYGYGTRREDQSEVIANSGLFGEVKCFEGDILHTMTLDDCVEAWRSHATLQRQAGDTFLDIVNAIEETLKDLGSEQIIIPYKTRVWAAQSLT